MKNPGSIGYWEGHTPPITGLPDNNQGQGQTVTSNGVPVPLIRAHGSSVFSYTVTVQLGIGDLVFPDGPPPPADRRGHILALLRWGQGGASFSAEVDWKVGTQVTLVATSLEVAARFDPEDGPQDALIERAIVNAALVWGSRPGELTVTRSQRRTFGAGASLILPIPNFASSLVLASSVAGVIDGSVPGLTVNFLGGPLATDRNYLSVTGASGAFLQALSSSGGIAIPGGARFLEIINGTGLAPLDVNAVWNLAL
jgi:hypothetical protein